MSGLWTTCVYSLAPGRDALQMLLCGWRSKGAWHEESGTWKLSLSCGDAADNEAHTVINLERGLFPMGQLGCTVLRLSAGLLHNTA